MLLSAASLLNELNFLDSRVKVEVRAFLVNVEYLLKDKYYYYLTTINDSHIETKMNRIKLEFNSFKSPRKAIQSLMKNKSIVQGLANLE